MNYLKTFLGSGLLMLGLSFSAQAQSTVNSQNPTVEFEYATEPIEGDITPPPSGGPGFQFELSVYPNPGNGEITINLPSSTRALPVIISDFTGDVIYRGSTQVGQRVARIDISTAQRGSYLIQVDEKRIRYLKY